MPDFGSFRGFGEKLAQGQTPTQLGLIGSEIFGIDTDAQAFFDRVTSGGGSLSETEKEAVNILVIQMKLDGIWTLMKAIYPMVGASAAACAQNLKSSSFTGSFSSGWTFASTGVTPNGTSAFMNSNLNASSNLSLNSTHLSYYSRTNNDGALGKVEIGYQITNPTSFFMAIRGYRGSQIGAMYDSAVNFLEFTNGNSNCFIINTRTSSTSFKSFKNGSQLGTTITGTNSGTLGNTNVLLGANGSSTVKYEYSDRQCAFASIGDGLDDTQSANLYTAVQAFQTTLSRQI
jgi:hypothetical protein